jgi:hypothetical protein
MCWAAYLSIFGSAALEQIPYVPWLLPAFIGLMLMNLVTLWPSSASRCDAPACTASQGRSRAGLAAFVLAASGAAAIVGIAFGLQLPFVAPLGLSLTVAGFFLSVRSRVVRRRQQRVFAAALSSR